MLSPNRALMRGVPTLVGESIDATGTDDVRRFSVLAPGQPQPVVTCQAIGSFSVFSGNLEITLNDGTTWSIYTAFDFVATAVFTFETTLGASYRFNVGAITQTVPPNILAILA